MEGSNLIYIPYRGTTGIPISSLLREVISNEFYQSASLFEDDLTGLNKLRNSVTTLLEHNSTDINLDLQTLNEYYCQICYIERKFPRDSIEFTWFSNNLTYQPHNKISLKSFQFEKLNILYNIASLFSQVAFQQDRTDLEGLKKASLYYQNAAGVFKSAIDYIQLIKDFQIPLEYSPEALTALQFLMLAQAQEAYWQRAISSSTDKIVAILSQQVGDFYKSSYDNFHKSQFILRTEFLNHISCKSFHFFAATHYRMAQHEYSLGNYGDQVAHLKQASQFSSKGLKSLKGVSEVVVDDIRGLDDVIKSTLKTAEKENDLIYHKDVPATLTPVVGRLMVKPLNVNELENPIKTIRDMKRGKLLFENLLPFIVIQSAQAFKERQEEFVLSNLINPINTLTKILKNYISERSLPLALDSLTKPQRLPENLVQHCNDLLSNDALNKLQKSLHELNKLSLESKRLIEGCKERLDIEAREDKEFRERQGSKRWTRISSKEASSDLLDKIKQFEQYLQQASSGDDTVRHNVNEIRPYIELMTHLAIPGDSGREKLINFIPMSGLVKLSPDLTQIIKQLKDVLSEAANEINKRLHFIEAVELKSRELSILPKIISEYRLLQANEDLNITEETFEPVFSKHMRNFDNDLNNLYKIRDEQSDLELRIDSLNKKFIAASSTTFEMSTARTEALQTLDDAYNGYKENLENIAEGLNFYHDYCTNVQNLLKKCDDFVYQRRVEGKELEQQFERNSSPTRQLPQTPIKSKIIKPPTSISQQRYKTSFSDDDNDDDDQNNDTSFYTDNDDSFEKNSLFVSSDGSKSPLKQKKMNNGDKKPTKVEESTYVTRRQRNHDNDDDEVKKKNFWDLKKHGIQFD